MVFHDRPNDIVSKLGGVVVPGHSGALVKGWFERATEEFVLASFTDLTRDCAPHIGHENDVLQRRVTAEFAERPEIPSGGSGKSTVGDAVDIDDSGKLSPFLVPVEGLSPEDGGPTGDLRLRGG